MKLRNNQGQSQHFRISFPNQEMDTLYSPSAALVTECIEVEDSNSIQATAVQRVLLSAGRHVQKHELCHSMRGVSFSYKPFARSHR
jgi:hypothetical protein